MSEYSFLEVVGMFLIPLIAVIIPVFLGQRAGMYYRKKQTEIPHDSIGSVVAAAFGLLAFMLAFTFQIAANRYDGRKELLIKEVNFIRTAYLRAGLIPEPYRTSTKNLLVEYVDLRAALIKDISKLDQSLAKSQVILDTLWAYTEALAAVDRSSEVYALYTTAINEMVDGYNERITMALVYRIPQAIMWVLSIILFLAMLILGYQFGVGGNKSPGLNFLLAILFSVVLFLIFALDRPETGLVKLNQKPLLSLQKQLREKQMKITKPVVP